MRKILWLGVWLFGVFLIASTALAASGAKLHVWVVSSSEKYRLDEIPRSDGWLLDPQTGSVHLFAARNETVAFQILLRPDTYLKITNAVFRWKSGTLTPVQLFLESYLYAPKSPKASVTLPPGMYPDPLVPFRNPYGAPKPVALPFTLKPKQTRGIWVDVFVPEEALPGDATGTLQLLNGKQVELTLNLSLHVWNFALPRSVRLHAWIPLYWERLAAAENLDPKSMFLPQNWPVVLRYYQMAHQHGFVTQIANGVDQPDVEWNEKTGALLSIDWQAYDRCFGPILTGQAFRDKTPPNLWKIGGWLWWGLREGDRPYFGGDYHTHAHLTAAYRRALRTYTRLFADHFKKKGWTTPELFWYLIDEPDFKSFPQLKSIIRELTEAIHSGNPRVKHLVTISPGLNPDMIGAVDIWATTASTYWVPAMQARQKVGEETWFYQEHPPFVGGRSLAQNGLSLRTWAWIARRYDVDGIFLWVGDFWPQDVYTNAKNWNEDYISNGIIFYPGRQLPQIGFPAIPGPVSSIRMKEWRRGMEDYAYFQLAGTKAVPIVRSIIRSALNPQEYNPYWRHPLWAHEGEWSHNPRDWEMARRRLAQIILQGK